MSTSINVKSAQFSVTASAYAELYPAGAIDASVVIYAEEDCWISVGHSTPADATSFKLLAGSALTISQPPLGSIQAKSVATAQTVYAVGA